MVRSLRRDNRHGVVLAAAIACVLFVGVLVTFPGDVVDRQKAPRELVRASGADNPDRDQRLAAYGWFQPSVVYYTGREVAVLESPAAVEAFLAVPTPGYLFVPEPVWREQFAARVRLPHRVAARHHDFLEKCDVLVISNEMRETSAAVTAGHAAALLLVVQSCASLAHGTRAACRGSRSRRGSAPRPSAPATRTARR